MLFFGMGTTTLLEKDTKLIFALNYLMLIFILFRSKSSTSQMMQFVTFTD